MAADVLAPCVARTSKNIVLIMQDKQVLIFHDAGFKAPVPFHCWMMTENGTYIFMFFRQ